MTPRSSHQAGVAGFCFLFVGKNHSEHKLPLLSGKTLVPAIDRRNATEGS